MVVRIEDALGRFDVALDDGLEDGGGAGWPRAFAAETYIAPEENLFAVAVALDDGGGLARQTLCRLHFPLGPVDFRHICHAGKRSPNLVRPESLMGVSAGSLAVPFRFARKGNDFSSPRPADGETDAKEVIQPQT